MLVLAGLYALNLVLLVLLLGIVLRQPYPTRPMLLLACAELLLLAAHTLLFAVTILLL